MVISPSLKFPLPPHFPGNLFSASLGNYSFHGLFGLYKLPYGKSNVLQTENKAEFMIQ